MIVRLLAALRVGLGVGMLATPQLVLRSLGVDAATARRLAWVARMLGGRELALGVGTLGAPEAGLDRWSLASAGADAGDLLALTVALRQRNVATGPGTLGAIFAAGAIAAEFDLVRRGGGRLR